MRTRVLGLAAVFIVLLAGVAVAAGGEGDGDGCGYPQGSEPVTLNPGEFSATIDNPYFPMRPGATWTYIEVDGDEEQTVTVVALDETKEIAGIEARIVRDTVRDAGGALVEDTFDWYAQDDEGAVWYLGEDTKEYEDGEVVSTEGSWEHGVDGALAGIIMPAEPAAGCAYRQEYLKGEAEDNGMVLATNERLQLEVGSYRDVVTTQDTSALEPWTLEHKYYARGVGLVVAEHPSSGAREELVSFKR